MAVEVVLLTPVLLLFALLVVACGRYVDLRGELAATTRDAARAASLERSGGAASAAASAVAAAELPARARCSAVGLDYRPADPGVPDDIGRATARLTCTVSYGDLGLIGLPGSADLTATSSAPLDRFRRADP
jgi:Flp pilus assembly protein TadG